MKMKEGYSKAIWADENWLREHGEAAYQPEQGTAADFVNEMRRKVGVQGDEDPSDAAASGEGKKKAGDAMEVRAVPSTGTLLCPWRHARLPPTTLSSSVKEAKANTQVETLGLVI